MPIPPKPPVDLIPRQFQPSKCSWTLNGDKAECPHTFRKYTEKPKVWSNILEGIGKTPLVRLNKLPKEYGIKCEVYVKVEFFNPGGSVKDRIAYRMIEDAERDGKLKPGSVVIEPTSGNTGIGLAMACAVKGYRCIIVMPENMSIEKVDTLKAFNVELIRTPLEKGIINPDGLFDAAEKLMKTIPNAVMLDQFKNPSNPLAHYDDTAEEIYSDLDGKVDMIVCGAGTGGTISGIGKKIKEYNPKCIIVGADPEASTLAKPDSLNDTDIESYETEGVGFILCAGTLDYKVIDKWFKSNDKKALNAVRKLIQKEGILAGASAGIALDCGLQAARELNEGQRCVILLPDGIRNYMTKFVSDNWMEARGLKDIENINNHWWWNTKISELPIKLISVNVNQTGLEAISIMKKDNLDEIIATDNNGKLMGVVTSEKLLNKIINLKTPVKESVESFMVRKFIKTKKTNILGFVQRVVEHEKFIVIIDDNEKPLGILTKLDVLNFIISGQNNSNGVEFVHN